MLYTVSSTEGLQQHVLQPCSQSQSVDSNSLPRLVGMSYGQSAKL